MLIELYCKIDDFGKFIQENLGEKITWQFKNKKCNRLLFLILIFCGFIKFIGIKKSS